MKKLLSGSLTVLISGLAVFLIFWSLPTTTRPNKENSTSMSDSEFFVHSDEISSAETSELVPSAPEEKHLLFDSCISLIESGVYRQTFEKQRYIGGYSVPVKTVTYFGKGFISIIENEMHNVVTEIFINKNGAYYISDDKTEATLMTADSVKLQSFPYRNLVFQCDGNTVLGLYNYQYERYLTEDGVYVEYLFLAGEIKKMKLYTDISKNDYDVFTLELSSDISDARTALPYGISIKDLR